MNTTGWRWVQWSGIPALSRKLLGARGRFVLCFHGISRRKRTEFPKAVQPYLDAQELRQVLEWVRGHFRFLTPEEFLENESPGVLLTFDDGLANHCHQVMPILNEFQAPAVFFVPTQPVAEPENRLPHLVLRLRQHWGDETAVPKDLLQEWYAGLSAGQLAACLQSPLVTVGSHTVNHPSLLSCPRDRLQFELEESRRFLEEKSGKPVTFFAYPLGHYDRRVAGAVRTAGYRAAFTLRTRELGLGAYEIPRVEIYSAAPAYLSLKLSGLHRRPVKGRQSGLYRPAS